MSEAGTCTVIVTVDAPRDALLEMAEHARLGITLFPNFDGFIEGHLRVSEDRTRLVQHLEWSSREAYVRCRDDESWETLPSTGAFMRHVETGAATVDARVYGLLAAHKADDPAS